MDFFRIMLFTVFVFLMPHSAVADAPLHSLDALVCDQPACDGVARRIAYQSDAINHTILLGTGPYFIQIPDDPLEKIVYLDGDIILKYRDGRQLIIGESGGPDIDDTGTKAISEFPEIIFLKTRSDPEPTQEKERLFWRVALYQKPAYFDEATEVTYSDNGDMRYYISNGLSMGFTGSAMVVSSNAPDRFLQLKSIQMKFETFKRIVYSVVTK